MIHVCPKYEFHNDDLMEKIEKRGRNISRPGPFFFLKDVRLFFFFFFLTWDFTGLAVPQGINYYSMAN